MAVRVRLRKILAVIQIDGMFNGCRLADYKASTSASNETLPGHF